LPTARPLAIVVDYRSASWVIRHSHGETTSMTGFDSLKAMGVSTDQPEATWEGYVYPEDEGDREVPPCQHRAVSVSWDEAHILLWNQIAQDVGVEPRAPVLSKLVDRERGVVVNAYDDRGMDIIALSPNPIEDLYRRFDAWLLDCDRPRMASVFGPRASGN
jgi:hypothetical protein